MFPLWMVLAGASVAPAQAPLWQQHALERVPEAWRTAGDGGPWDIQLGVTERVHGGARGHQITVPWPDPPPANAEALQRALSRNLVIALALQHDGHAHVSEQDAWRRYNGWTRSWLSPWLHALNREPLGFAEAAGMESPALEWATMVGHVLVPEPAVGNQTPAQCRLLSQGRFVRDVLASLGRTVDAPDCPGFDLWARQEALREVQVGVALPSAATAGALFGHVFLRFVYEQPQDTRVIAFLANTQGPLESDGWYPVKGLFGFLETRVFDRSWLESLRLYQVEEGRDIRLWRLRLDADSRTRLLERLWDLRIGGAFDYFFFRYNCASLLLDVFNSILPETFQIRHFGHLGESPSAVMDALAWARSPLGGPLLQPTPAESLSLKHTAELADLARRDAARTLERISPVLASPLRQTRSAEGQERAAAYAKLAHVTDDATRPALARYLEASASVELMHNTRDNLRAEMMMFLQRRKSGAALLREERTELLQAVLASGGEGWRSQLANVLDALSTDDLEMRYSGYARMAAYVKAWEAHGKSDEALAIGGRLRLWALVNADHWFDETARDIPTAHFALFARDPGLAVLQQPYIKPHRSLVDFTFSTRLAEPLIAAQAAFGKVSENGDALPAALELSEQGPLEERYGAAWPHAGIDTWEATFGQVAGSTGSVTTATFGGSGFEERLGDATRHGFPTDTALTLLAGSTTFTLVPGERPHVLRYSGDVLSYRSVRASWETGRTLGWDVSIHLENDAVLGEDFETHVAVGMLLPLWHTPLWRDHVLVRLGVTALAWRGLTSPFLGGAAVPLSLEARVAATETSHVRARIDIAPTYLVGLQWTARAETRAVARLWPDCMVLGVEHVGVGLVAQGTVERGLAWQAKNPWEARGEVGVLFE